MLYQKISIKIWNDEKFTSLSASEQRLFFYFLTCPHHNLIGLYVLKRGYACDDLKSFPKDFQKDLRKLLEKGLIEYDEDLSVALIPNYLVHNPLTNDNQFKAAVRYIHELPKTKLFHRFREILEGLPEGLTKGLREVLPKDIGNYDNDYEYDNEINTLSGSSKNDSPDSARSSDSNLKKQALEVLEFLNEKANRTYRPVDSNLTLIMGRLKSGATVQNCKGVIARKCADWLHDPEMNKYLRPETLFNKTKFESYLGQRKKEASCGAETAAQVSMGLNAPNADGSSGS